MSGNCIHLLLNHDVSDNDSVSSYVCITLGPFTL